MGTNEMAEGRKRGRIYRWKEQGKTKAYIKKKEIGKQIMGKYTVFAWRFVCQRVGLRKRKHE